MVIKANLKTKYFPQGHCAVIEEKNNISKHMQRLRERNAQLILSYNKVQTFKRKKKSSNIHKNSCFCFCHHLK